MFLQGHPFHLCLLEHHGNEEGIRYSHLSYGLEALSFTAHPLIWSHHIANSTSMILVDVATWRLTQLKILVRSLGL